MFGRYCLTESSAQKNLSDTEIERRFFGSGHAKAAIHTLLLNCKVARIATAFFEPSGWAVLNNALENTEVRLLIGREEGAADRINDLLQDFFQEMYTGHLKENPGLLRKVLQALRNGLLTIKTNKNLVSTKLDARYLYHHAKLYMADERAVIVTSANFTKHGLEQSREAGYLVEFPEHVKYFVEKFDEYFANARSVTEEFIIALEELLELKLPNDVYCRSLLEMYGIPEGTTSKELPAPTSYQIPVISRLIRSISEYGGAFLVASTGLGKTVMAAHTVAILRAQGKIGTVLVFCPAGLKDMWSQSMRSAKVSSREFSYQILSVDDWQKYRQALILDDELKRDLREMLIILDESHHMRNDEDTESEMSLRHSRVLDAVNKGARVLLMTATPYSRSIDDINNQLRILPKRPQEGMFFTAQKHWTAQKVSELSELPPCTMLTAPTVIRFFSRTDEIGRKYIEFGNERKMYFPSRIHLRSIQYKNQNNVILKELKNSGFLKRKAESAYTENLFGDKVTPGKTDFLFEARLLHQFCSSAAQVHNVLEKMSKPDGYEKIRFESQTELTSLAQKLLKKTKSADDEKLKALAEIVNKHTNEKIVIFCIYRETAKNLFQSLKKEFPNIVFNTSVDKNPDDLENILDFFAPVANGKIVPGEGENEFSQRMRDHKIDILIASEAISEGFNLQDSRILVNYDLPWSILQLAQRMGRLMRPWHEPRELYIYNFLPDTLFDTDLRHGQAWRERLQKRNEEHQSFANLPVILPHQKNEAVNLEALGTALREFDETDLDLEEAMKFIGNATSVTTSSILDDLAQITHTEYIRLKNMRPGFRSRIEKEKDDPSLYMLIQVRGAFFPALFNAQGGMYAPPNEVSRPLELLRMRRYAPIFEKDFDYTNLVSLEEKCLQTWLDKVNENRERTRIICALHFA